MISDETFAILRLIRTRGVGEKTALALMNHYQSAENVLKYHKKIDFISQGDVDKEIKEHLARGIKIITFKDPCYPKQLKEIPNFPFVLSVFGNTDTLNQPCISVVGSRNASYHALSFAKQLAFDIVQNKCVIVSGMARGIDSAAHLGALPAATIAVLAGGVDRIYPQKIKSFIMILPIKAPSFQKCRLELFPVAPFFQNETEL
jgi:DNA processing protein